MIRHHSVIGNFSNLLIISNGSSSLKSFVTNSPLNSYKATPYTLGFLKVKFSIKSKILRYYSLLYIGKDNLLTLIKILHLHLQN